MRSISHENIVNEKLDENSIDKSTIIHKTGVNTSVHESAAVINPSEEKKQDVQYLYDSIKDLQEKNQK